MTETKITRAARPTDAVLIALALLPLGVAAASAQTWPARPIRAIIPFAAGSFTDVLPRLVFDRVSSQLKQAIVVENRGGAGGTIGTGAVAKADPDGYTLLAHSSAHTIAPAIYPNLSYDTARDLAAVVSLGDTPLVMLTSPAKGYKNLRDFVNKARANPGSINYASAGVGTATHLGAERFRSIAKFDAVHIPLKGGPEALTEIIAGRSDFYFCPLGTALPLVREGTVQALAVSSSKRLAVLPDVASTIEAGYPDSDYTFWVGVFVPAKTPREIINRLHDETAIALEVPAIKEKVATLGALPMVMSPEDFDAHVKKEIVTSAALARAAGLKPN